MFFGGGSHIEVAEILVFATTLEVLMLNEKGFLTPEEKEKFSKWIRTKNADNLVCPVCNHQQWEVGDFIVAVPLYSRDFHLSPSYPLIPLFCKNCAYTHLFNAIQAEILESAAGQANR
jgi:hypothetical protein